jgi:NADH-quinone oxidoreductase subunit L
LLGFVFALIEVPKAFGDAASGVVGYGVPLASWYPGFDFGLLWDPLSVLWTLVITGIGGLIHVYSIGYMAADKAIARFFAYLNFFVFAMLTLVLSDNFVGLLVGWGLVGLASYFLISFWFSKPSAVAAGRKAFVINVFGDVGLMFAIFVLFAQTGTLTFGGVFAKVGSIPEPLILAACIGLLIAAAAKSAQVPLHTWLPDAMEGPTPVSALIHAATMVTAGVYLIARCAPLWDASPEARAIVGTIGALTALVGALLGIGQWDIKRILAYSTMSQIGYMIMAVGIGAYQAGVLHFYTHAFFKAQLFLTAGIIIHALHDEQDVRKMGGLRTKMPFAFYSMLVGVLAIIGFPGLSGFFSKDAIIYGALERGYPLLYAVGVLTAGITAYYMFRLFFVVFFGTYRGEVASADLGMPAIATQPAHGEHGVHAPDWLMQAPVALLGVGAVVAGYVNVIAARASGGESQSLWASYFTSEFAPQSLAGAPIPEIASTALVLVVVAIGVGIAWARYGPAFQTAAVPKLRTESEKMPAGLTHAFYFNEALGALFVKPAVALGGAFARFVEPRVIDGLVKDVVWVVGYLGAEFRALPTGLVRGYALTIVVGVACFLAYFAFVGAAR